MKLKVKHKIQQVERTPSSNTSEVNKHASWEMSAQDALRVNYVTRKNTFPLNPR